jgi:hypothetical protein
VGAGAVGVAPGTSLCQARPRTRPVRRPSCRTWLHIYGSHEGQLDGKPLFDEDLNINLEDFEVFEEDRIGPALEILSDHHASSVRNAFEASA